MYRSFKSLLISGLVFSKSKNACKKAQKWKNINDVSHKLQDIRCKRISIIYLKERNNKTKNENNDNNNLCN